MATSISPGWYPLLGDVPFVAGNDATLAGLAEARRGVAAGVPVVLYLSVEVGIGGVLLVGGRPLLGALGEAGSSGTCRSAIRAALPVRSARCWDLEVDGRALARALGRRAPRDPPVRRADARGGPNRGSRTSLLP